MSISVGTNMIIAAAVKQAQVSMSRPAVCTWWAKTFAGHHVEEHYVPAAHLGLLSSQQLVPHSFQAAKSVEAVDSDGAHSDSQRGRFAGWVHEQDVGACFAGLLPSLRPLQAVALLFISVLGRTGLLRCRKEERGLSSAHAQVLTDTSRHQHAVGCISGMLEPPGGPLQELAGHARTRPSPAASSTRRWWLMGILLQCSGALQLSSCLSA